MTTDEVLEQCFLHFYGLDVSNAAIHCALVRFSPITFRCQEAMLGCSEAARGAWIEVRAANGTYSEDPGR